MSIEARVWQHNPYRRATAQDGNAGELWSSYQTGTRTGTTDPALREQLILKYAPLVKYVAGRLGVFLPPALSMDDLLGHGTVGLIEAVDRYDAFHGVKFETYAIRRIWGSMIDALRSLSMLPRSTIQQVKSLDSAFATLEHELGRSPTTAEVAERLGVGETEVYSMLLAANFSLLSLETKVTAEEDGGLTLLDTLADGTDGPEVNLEKEELLASLARAIERLPERERLVLSLYYHEDLTLKEIGKVLQVSESRVSQLHSVALARLRAALAPLRGGAESGVKIPKGGKANSRGGRTQ